MEPITPKDIYKVMLDLVTHPFSQICKHSAACELYTLLEQKGVDIPVELAASLVAASEGDEESIKILKRLMKEKGNDK
jgi:hypothetical protein